MKPFEEIKLLEIRTDEKWNIQENVVFENTWESLLTF